jgi:hypothetical protein
MMGTMELTVARLSVTPEQWALEKSQGAARPPQRFQEPSTDPWAGDGLPPSAPAPVQPVTGSSVSYAQYPKPLFVEEEIDPSLKEPWTYDRPD